MKHLAFIMMAFLLWACSSNSGKATDNSQKDKTSTEQAAPDTSANAGGEVAEGDDPSLNDIRFANFKDADWLNNEYIRQLRAYINDFNAGKIEDEELEAYKDKVRGQFAIYNVEPFLLGGLFIQFVFVDNPDDIFSSWVYSDVDEGTKAVTGYSVHAVKMEDMKSGFSKEDILKIVNENENMKLW